MPTVIRIAPWGNAIPFGRLAELNLSARPDAGRLAIDYGRGVFSDCTVYRFNTRQAMARRIRKDQEKYNSSNFTPIVELGETEGY